MQLKNIILLIVGIVLVLLGGLWFLQGSDIVHLNPILCFADCEPVAGRSITWQLSGMAVVISGVSTIIKSINKHGSENNRK